ncbi:MAG: glycosyltransferase family 4 protein [Candidatus Sericytochromatia bacterium]
MSPMAGALSRIDLGGSGKRPQVLMLGQYPLDRLDIAPKVRTYSIWQALTRIADVTCVTGTRASRRRPLQRLIAQGHLGRFDCAYLEAATSTSMETDLLLLRLLKAAGVPIGIYIRDAYNLFELAPTETFKEKLLHLGWFVSQYWYRQTASTLFFPSQLLADCFSFPRREVLMPAGEATRLPPPYPGPFKYVLFAGRLDAGNGWTHLRPAMELVASRFPQVRLLALTKLEVEDGMPPWLEIRRGTLDDVIADLPEIACGVVPRPHSSYNDMAIPLKLMDYLSLGLPLVTTRCKEMAELVERDGLGLTSDDSPAGLAENLCRIFAEPGLQQELARTARASFLARHTWDRRAEQVVASLRNSRQTVSCPG